MNLGDRVVGGLRSLLLIDERVQQLKASLSEFRSETSTTLKDHEKRLVRLETIVEIAKPSENTVLKIAARPPDRPDD